MKQITTFDNSPFFDDYDISKNFYRVLFRPGYSVQTRELNQLQSILAQQISHISDFAIADKTAVVGGNLNFNKSVDYIELDTRTSLSYPTLSYNNTVKFSTIDGITGKLILAVNNTDTGKIRIYLRYETSSITTGRHYPSAGEQIQLTFENGDTETITSSNITADYKGQGTTAFLDDSIYYIKGCFVKISSQVLVLTKDATYSPDDTYTIGVLINESAISPDEDFSLYDNAYGTPNESAPGAYRYKISGLLIEKKDVPNGLLENFIELKRLEKGEIANKPKEESDVIPLLEQILARRTYDESGDYIVDTFNLDVREHLRLGDNNGVYYRTEGGDNTKFVAQLDSGVGYVRGYEARIEGVTRLSINKARATKEIKDNVIQLNYSNYIIVAPIAGDIVIGAKINLLNVSSAVIGTGIVSGVEVINGSAKTLKIYLINITSTASLYDVKTVKHDSTVTNHTEFNATYVSHNITNIYSTLVYPLRYGNSKQVTPKTMQQYKTYPTSNTSGNTVNISTQNSNEQLSTSPKDYYVYLAASGFFAYGTPDSVNVNTSGVATLNVTTLLAGRSATYSVKVIATSFLSNPGIKNKTLNNIIDTLNTTTHLINGRAVLSKADGFKLKSIKVDGIDVTTKFTFDNGSRDSHYEKAAIVLKSGQSVKPDKALIVEYSYFLHSASGEFFTANSYNISDIGGYDNLPIYNSTSGESTFLGSAIDFRKIIGSNGSIENLTGTTAAINEYITVDAEFYLARKDRIMITAAKNIVHLEGKPDFNPVLPEELNDAITLYNLDISPYTFNINDIYAEKLKHKRYTMKDIASLETRIKNVEEVALLNKLEEDTATINFEDRFKSGYVVDNFSTSNTGNVSNEHFGVAYDIISNSARAKIASEFIDLTYLSSVGVKLHESTGIITLDYDVEEFISQPLASSIVNIQPYINYYWGTGTVVLTPNSDIWKQEFAHTEWIYTGNTTILDDRIINNVTSVTQGRPPIAAGNIVIPPARPPVQSGNIVTPGWNWAAGE